MEKEELFKKRMLELSKKSYYRGILTYSDFLDLNDKISFTAFLFQIQEFRFCYSGGYETAERQMAAFVSDAFCCKEDYPIACIKISPLKQEIF